MLNKKQTSTPGTRHRVRFVTGLSNVEPEKALLLPGHMKRQGRGFRGRITVRHRGGGVKRRLRQIEWKRNRVGVPATVKKIAYDPMRSANLALLFYADGAKSYILAPEGVVIGDVLMSGDKAELKVGNALPLSMIPVGMTVHNIEMRPGKGAQLVRSAGVGAFIQSKENGLATIQLPSRELRLIPESCYATIGQVGNGEWKNNKYGKAGRKRLLGIRPTVRGTAQHPDSHPHGGGEGRSGVGMKYPKTPWGKPAMGKITRKRKHSSNKYIVRRRPKTR